MTFDAHADIDHGADNWDAELRAMEDFGLTPADRRRAERAKAVHQRRQRLRELRRMIRIATRSRERWEDQQHGQQ